eukprot:3635-Chlamydomonas_euryale.AAC.6
MGCGSVGGLPQARGSLTRYGTGWAGSGARRMCGKKPSLSARIPPTPLQGACGRGARVARGRLRANARELQATARWHLQGRCGTRPPGGGAVAAAWALWSRIADMPAPAGLLSASGTSSRPAEHIRHLQPAC